MINDIKTPAELRLINNSSVVLYISEWMKEIEKQFRQKEWAFIPRDCNEPQVIDTLLSCFKHYGWYPIIISSNDQLKGIFFFDALSEEITLNHEDQIVRDYNLTGQLVEHLEFAFSYHQNDTCTRFLREKLLTYQPQRLFQIWESRRKK